MHTEALTETSYVVRICKSESRRTKRPSTHHVLHAFLLHLLLPALHLSSRDGKQVAKLLKNMGIQLGSICTHTGICIYIHVCMHIHMSITYNIPS